ncbi:MAG TPA: protease inhibitor I9 family protein, partial [Candidatus Nanoarchaeia archaeon]|nr:protease inhibitor I9 family protein [Candidatus Nanoarchaeia archaeon]
MNKFAIVFLLIVASNIVFAGKIDPLVEQELEENGEASVIIVMNEPAGKTFLNAAGKDNRKRENVIASLSEDSKLSVKHKYSAINAFSARVSDRSIEKLSDDPNIKSVHLSKRYYATLDVSVPLINATSTWGISIGDQNITGAGQTVCVIDTGVDYNHTSLGSGWGNVVIGG